LAGLSPARSLGNAQKETPERQAPRGNFCVSQPDRTVWDGPTPGLLSRVPAPAEAAAEEAAEAAVGTLP